MLRTTALLLLILIGSLNACSQTLSVADLHGSWYFHQHYVDSALFADADKPTPFPKRDHDRMEQTPTTSGMQLPDRSILAAMLKQNDENYRRYRIEFKEDSTYLTELAAGMTKWLPVNGRVMRTDGQGQLQLVDAFGTVTTTAMEIKDGELHLDLAGPLNTVLLFRRKEP